MLRRLVMAAAKDGAGGRVALLASEAGADQVTLGRSIGAT